MVIQIISEFYLVLIHSVFHFIQGVMMTHANVLATVSAVMTIVPGLVSNDIYLAYLPMAHILELAAEVCSICILVLSITIVVQ